MDILTDQDRLEIKTIRANKIHEKALGRGILVTDTAEYLILCGHPDITIYRVIKNEFPKCNTTLHGIAVMRSDLRRRRPDVDSSLNAHRNYHKRNKIKREQEKG